MGKLAGVLGINKGSQSALKFSLEDILREFQRQRELIEQQQ
jgi:hypothetical protein